MAEITLVKKDGSLTLGGNKFHNVEEVYVGDTAPTEDSYKLWVSLDGELPDEVATKEYVDEKIKNIDLNDLDIDLSSYATTEYVDKAIETIELTPGPQGEPGPKGDTPVKGTDYWTNEDKAAMVQDVLDALPAAEDVEV